jgi:hypothetical protein
VHLNNAPYGGPFYELNSDTPLVFQFDAFEEFTNDLFYSIQHCGPNFLPDDIDISECIQGFSENRISTPESSLNTRQSYDHYSFALPNEMTQFRRGGNYLVSVFEGNSDSDDIQLLAAWHFVVYENKTSLGLSVRPGTPRSLQEVNVRLNAGNIPATDSDKLKLVLVQNQNFNQAICNLTPSFTPSMNEFIYEYSDGRNSFLAGGEYRMFEFKNPRTTCYGVDYIDNENIFLQPEVSEKNRSYTSRTDINGNHYIITQNNELSFSDHVNADYFTIHFQLKTEGFEGDEIYLECSGIPNRYEKCYFTEANESYRCSFLLKQGVYSYRFVQKIDGKFIPFSEGNYFETENDYTVLIYGYNRQLGGYECYGVKKINSQN